ncbi:MAG: ATP-binding cassette domain-containing protein [Bacteroidales bacterium]|nr:ATP-binding cassette domain-containing protein [Bacteroidales bacterium]
MENTDNKAAEEPVVLLENVTISHDREPLLSNVNLNIADGEFVYLIGRSGTGKTSLLRSLYADLPIESGKASVCGFDIAKMRRRKIPHLRRRIGMVFQDFRLLGDRNVYANLEFVLRSIGWHRRDEIRSRINEVLAAVGIADKSEEMPMRLSEGQQQRVGIARALVGKPDLILADEPTGNLDPVTSAEIMQLLTDINRDTHTTMLISTHDFMTIDRFPARVLVCENGTVVDSEAPNAQ